MTSDTPSVPRGEAAAAPLPLFYKDPVLLRFEEHRDAGLVPAAHFGFAGETAAVPLCGGEFVAAVRHYPIVFSMGEDVAAFALVGIERDRNLFIERDGGWTAGSYVPAYVRRYPFTVMETADRSQQLLSVDRGSDRFVASASARADAQRLFDAEGGPTEAARLAMAFCHAYHTDISATAAFGRALRAAGILLPYHADFRLHTGAPHQVSGFHAVDEKAFRALPAETVAQWHGKGWLDLVTLHLASLQNFSTLIDHHARRASERKALS